MCLHTNTTPKQDFPLGRQHSPPPHTESLTPLRFINEGSSVGDSRSAWNMSQWQRAANYNYDLLITVSVGRALDEVCIGLHLINITNIWRVKGIILTLSYFLILFQFQFSAPLFFINNNNMLLSIHHTAHGHLFFIKWITLPGRVIIVLYQYPSPSRFHKSRTQ